MSKEKQRSRSRIRVQEATYYLNEDQQTVTCKLDCYLQLQKHNCIYRLFNIYTIKNNVAAHFPRLKDLYQGAFTVTATAKCHKDDKFDAELGRRIAESKAKMKAFKFGKKFYDYLDTIVYTYLNELKALQHACLNASNTEEAHLQKLQDETNC